VHLSRDDHVLEHATGERHAVDLRGEVVRGEVVRGEV